MLLSDTIPNFRNVQVSSRNFILDSEYRRIPFLFAKKSTGISTTYFTIGAFFTLITSCNLIAKGNFYDTTITMSLFKGCLYASVVVIAIVVKKLYPVKD